MHHFRQPFLETENSLKFVNCSFKLRKNMMASIFWLFKTVKYWKKNPTV